jgi:hypothetical protein
MPVMRRPWISLLAPSLVGLASAAMLTLACNGGADLKKLTVDEVAAKVAAHDSKTFIYDDNPHDRYLKGHVPGAKWLESVPTVADLPADKGALLVFYCSSEL